jgi:putative ABC transport system substrate-binding protein
LPGTGATNEIRDAKFPRVGFLSPLDDVVPSLERPSGNVTGVTSFDPQQAGKQLELLKKLIPGLRRVVILGDQGVSEALMKASEGQAQALGLQPQRFRVGGPTPDLEGVFTAVRQKHADAMLVLEEPIVVIHSQRIAELANYVWKPLRAMS